MKFIIGYPHQILRRLWRMKKYRTYYKYRNELIRRKQHINRELNNIFVMN